MVDEDRERHLRPRDLIRWLQLEPDAVVADVGAGAGFFAIHLADAVPRGRVVVTDIRKDLLAIAARKLRANRSQNAETRLVPPTRVGLEPRSCDLILLCQVDHHLADRESYFRELKSALRPEGRIALVNFAPYYHVNLTAARRASLVVKDEWTPSPGYFALTLVPAR